MSPKENGLQSFKVRGGLCLETQPLTWVQIPDPHGCAQLSSLCFLTCDMGNLVELVNDSG